MITYTIFKTLNINENIFLRDTNLKVTKIYHFHNTEYKKKSVYKTLPINKMRSINTKHQTKILNFTTLIINKIIHSHNT